MLVSDLNEVLSRKQMAASKRRSVVRAIIKGHMKRWSEKSVAVQRQYDSRARRHAATERRRNLEKLQALRTIRNDLERKLLEDNSATKPIGMAQCALEDRHIATLAMHLGSDTFNKTELNSLREKAMTAPLPPAPWEMQKLDEAMGMPEPPEPHMPQWAKDIAANRDEFRAVVLRVELEGRDEYYKILYCVRSPCYVALAHLELVPHYTEIQQVTADSWAAINQDRVRYRLKVNFAKHSSAAEVPLVSAERIHVIPDTLYTGGVFIQGSARSIPLTLYLRSLASTSKPTRDHDEDEPREPKAKGIDVDDLPWLRGCLRDFDFWEIAHKNATKKKYDDGGSDSDEAELADEELEAALDELHTARAMLLEDAPEFDFSHFRIVVLGGKWLKLNRDQAYDAVKAICRGNDAEAFCLGQKLNRSARFTVAYTMASCGILARSWCHRMQHFRDVAASRPEGYATHFTAADVAAYVEPDELRRLADSTTNPDVMGRITDIRDLFAP
jgi:hypothetical protein